jgi:hypothetical protein
MNKDQIANFSWGYNECQMLILGYLREILKLKTGQRKAVEVLLKKQEAEFEANHWRCIQEECPGITREEYEAGLEAGAQAIRESVLKKKWGHCQASPLKLKGYKNE